MTTFADTTPALPGFVNAHSHAFQRLMRGEVQRGAGRGAVDSFWTWRDAMYRHAGSLDVAGVERAARLLYAESLEAGYTAVGEFHYLHHPRGTDDDGLAAARAILRAARQTGIRCRLLLTAYRMAGFDTPLRDDQRPFLTPDLATVERLLDAVLDTLRGDDPSRLGVGLAIHSVRAVPRDWFGPLAALSAARGLPLHVHAAEQPAEVEACRRATGLSPIALLAAEGALSPSTSIVHATWCDDADLGLIAASGARVVLCPTTEGDLGDGFPRTRDMRDRGIPLAIGSDSHAVVDPFAELRKLEYDARGRAGQRCVLADDDGDLLPPLLEIGARLDALGFEAAAGRDRVTLDGGARAFEAVAPRHRPIAAILGGHAGLVDVVEVGGDRLVERGRHLFV